MVRSMVCNGGKACTSEVFKPTSSMCDCVGRLVRKRFSASWSDVSERWEVEDDEEEVEVGLELEEQVVDVEKRLAELEAGVGGTYGDDPKRNDAKTVFMKT